MKPYILALLLTVIAGQGRLMAQQDSPATLQWVERQAGRIDTLLEDAIQVNMPGNLTAAMLRAHQLFDAVLLGGVYCLEVRRHAEEGRRQTDVLIQYFADDMLAGVQRANSARLAAEKMRLAADACMKPAVAVGNFGPVDLVREEAGLARMMLEDGLAGQNLHALNQKMEYALRMLQDVDRLSTSLEACGEVQSLARAALAEGQTVRLSSNWAEAERRSQVMLGYVRRLDSARCE
jgi:hypothetical protein